ncbi:MAG: SPW repeat protein, partial [Actinomycetota bacterium]
QTDAGTDAVEPPEGHPRIDRQERREGGGGTSMRPWTRPQDFATLIAGAYAALSPIWVSTTGERDAFWALIALGALLAATSLFSLAMPGVVATEWLTVLFGVLLFVAPWVLTYTDRVGASWTSWVVGAIAVVLGGFSVPASNRIHRQAILP